MIRTVCSTPLHRDTHRGHTPGTQGTTHTHHPTKNKVPISSNGPAHNEAGPASTSAALGQSNLTAVVDLTPSLTADPRWFHLRLFCIRNRSEAPGISPETPASLHLCISQPSIVNPHIHHLNHPRLPASGSTPRGQPTTRSTCIRQSYPDLPGLHSIRGSLLVYGLFLGPKLSVKG
jgi:hypothetical protein